MVITAVLATSITSVVWNLKPQHPLQPVRFAIVPPTAQPFAPQGADRDIAISPDGTKIVYRANAAGRTQLVVRSIDQLDARVLVGINDARTPFISADNHWLGFLTPSASKQTRSQQFRPAS